MNYYIDFDSTLYDTSKMSTIIFETIISSILEQKAIDKNKLVEECKTQISTTSSIYDLPEYFSNKYNLEPLPILNNLKNSILNSENLVFPDVKPFLKNLKKLNHKLYILTFAKLSLQFQMDKLTGSKLSDLFDGIYITSTPKYELDINYSNGIFIDDNPTDLLGLYSKNPIEVIRINRKNSRYSQKSLENNNIKEYMDFSEVPII